MLGKLALWIVQLLDPTATRYLQQELAHQKEMVVPRLERELAVLKLELQIATAVNVRNLARVEAETAHFSRQIASAGE